MRPVGTRLNLENPPPSLLAHFQDCRDASESRPLRFVFLHLSRPASQPKARIHRQKAPMGTLGAGPNKNTLRTIDTAAPGPGGLLA